MLTDSDCAYLHYVAGEMSGLMQRV